MIPTKPTDPTPAASRPSLPERYGDARLVARGGMGEVWRAHDTQLGRDVACKLLVPGAGPEPEETRRERFQREARAIAQLSTHPHVVTIYDIGELDGWPWLVMEWLPGGTLADRIADGRFSRADAMRWLAQIADALDAAHAAGIVHRDVKPGNVLFDESEAVRIGDFGIARWSVESALMLTQPGAVIGTAAYMSPEQARGDAAGPEGDQYALMVIAWQLLVGARPFERDSAVAELAAHASEPVPSAADRGGLPASVDAVFERALAKDPKARFASCREAVAALDAALDDPAPTRRLTPAAATTTVRVSRSDGPGLPGMGTSPRTRLVLAIAAVLLLAVLVLPALSDEAPDGSASRAPVTTTDGGGPSATRETEPAVTPEPEEPSAAEDDAGPLPEREPVDPTDAIARHEEAFRLLQAGRFDEALPMALGALQDLRGVAPYEAYANYNVGASLVGLGRCDEAIPYLDRSEQLQGQRDPIDVARAACEGEAGAGGGKGKGKGKANRDRDDD